MYTENLEYDGIQLSDFGLMICSFDEVNGAETVSSGADITFNTIKSSGSDCENFYGAKYDEVYTTTFHICKKQANGINNMYLEPNLVSSVQRWLCRKDGFHKMKFIQDDLQDIYWNVACSCKEKEISGRAAGLEVTIKTDSPYAYLSEQTTTNTLEPGGSFSIYDMSDETGYTYPKVKITCTGAGKIELSNSMSEKVTILTNVSNNEVITLNHKIPISSSITRTDLPNSFNYYYPKIVNTYANRENVFSLSDDSVGCTVEITYSPIIKVGL